MANMVVLAVFPLLLAAHGWGHGHGPGAARGHAVSLPPEAHANVVPSGGDASGMTLGPARYTRAPAKAPEPQTVHYVVIPIDCRYLTKAAKARMCERPIMRAASAQARKENTTR
jgi:hypothetical protein